MNPNPTPTNPEPAEPAEPELPKLSISDRLALLFSKRTLPVKAHDGKNCRNCGVELSYLPGATGGLCSNCYAKQHPKAPLPRSIMRASQTMRRGNRKHHKAVAKIWRWSQARQQSPANIRLVLKDHNSKRGHPDLIRSCPVCIKQQARAQTTEEVMHG